MGTVKLNDKLHSIIKDNLNILAFQIEYKDAKGFVDKAVYNLLLEEKLIKKEVKKK